MLVHQHGENESAPGTCPDLLPPSPDALACAGKLLGSLWLPDLQREIVRCFGQMVIGTGVLNWFRGSLGLQLCPRFVFSPDLRRPDEVRCQLAIL